MALFLAEKLSNTQTAQAIQLACEYGHRLYLLAAMRIAIAGAPEEVLTPEWVRSVYGVEAVRGQHPVTGRLHLAFVATDR